MVFQYINDATDKVRETLSKLTWGAVTYIGCGPQDASGKWRFRLGFPILKMVHNPGGHWHPGRGATSNIYIFFTCQMIGSGKTSNCLRIDMYTCIIYKFFCCSDSGYLVCSIRLLGCSGSALARLLGFRRVLEGFGGLIERFYLVSRIFSPRHPVIVSADEQGVSNHRNETHRISVPWNILRFGEPGSL